MPDPSREAAEPSSISDTAGAPPAPPPNPKSGVSRSRRFWNKTTAAITAVIGLVGAVTGVISVIPILTRDATNFSHLEISAQPVAGDSTEWAIPAEALDAGFPVTGDPCGDEQLAWLKANGESMQRSLMLNARNAASEGAMLALTEFRSTAKPGEDRGALQVRLVCAPNGVMPELLYYGKLLADEPDAQAVHVKIDSSAATNASPEMPVAFNLAPGESGKIPIDLFSRYPVHGALQVTVLSRDESKVFEVEGSEFEMPALLYGGEIFLFTTQEGLKCNRIEAGTLLPCTLDELRHELEVAPR